MRIILNMTTLVVGGALQVSASFLDELNRKKEVDENEFFVFLSQTLANLLRVEEFGEKFTFHVFAISPAPLKNRRAVLKRLNSLEHEIRPDVVFTIFGPCYWRPKSLHLMGIAVGWCYNFDSIAWRVLSFKEMVKMRLKVAYRNYYLKRDADYYVVETEQVKLNVNRFLGVTERKVSVVSNTCSRLYQGVHLVPPESATSGVIQFFVLSANYIHKNLRIINDIIPLLRGKLQKEFQFIVTLTDEDFSHIFGEKNKYVVNAGVLNVNDCVAYYQRADVLFLPTLLESFTATYLEAMAMRRPIITPDLDFAHVLCGDAALYYSALSAAAAADKLVQVVNSASLYEKLVSNGTEQLEKFPTAQERADEYIALCHKIIKI